MSTLEHIQSEIKALPVDEFLRLRAWFNRQFIASTPLPMVAEYGDWMAKQVQIARERSNWIQSNQTPRDEKWFEELRQESWDIKPEDIEDEPWQERDWDALFA